MFDLLKWRLGLVSALFIFFLYFFGCPSLQKYWREDIVLVTSSSSSSSSSNSSSSSSSSSSVSSRSSTSSGLPPPAVTVCAVGPGSLGWKKEGNCHNKTSLEDLRDCVQNNHFTLNDTIAGVYIKSTNGAEPVTPIWKSSMATPLMGVCHTMVYKEPLSIMDGLDIVLGKEPRSYKVFLHDSTFFLQKSDSYFIPFVFLNKPKGENYKIVTSRNTRMNRPGKFECNKGTDYNFNQCVTQSLAIKLGCTFPWAAEASTENIHICNTTEKLNAYWSVYNTMYLANQHSIFDLTGCKVPCGYNHYSVVGSPATFDMMNITYVSLSFASTDLTEIHEVWLYLSPRVIIINIIVIIIIINNINIIIIIPIIIIIFIIIITIIIITLITFRCGCTPWSPWSVSLEGPLGSSWASPSLAFWTCSRPPASVS